MPGSPSYTVNIYLPRLNYSRTWLFYGRILAYILIHRCREPSSALLLLSVHYPFYDSFLQFHSSSW